MAPRRIMLLLLCFIHFMGSIALGERSKNFSAPPVQPMESYTSSEEKNLEDESENQENILSQLLGDYDKVKAISEGSNCKCKCVVKPLNRDSCERSRNGVSQPEDFYTVETITSGPDCKCACVAPPSALNPCEGDFRLKKLRETEKNGFKLSTIIEMLEGAFYGLDLLKLHSVTTKIVGRVEKLEEVISKNITKEQEKIKDRVDGILSEINNKEENATVDENLRNIGKILQRDAAAVYSYTHEKYEEQFLRDEQAKPHPAPPQQVQRSPLSQRQLHVRPKPAPKPVIRGVTFYKAKVTEDDSELDDQQDDSYSGDNTIDMLIEDQLLKHEFQQASTTEDLNPTKETLTSNDITGYTKLSNLSHMDISTPSAENLVDNVTTSEITEQTSSLQQTTTELTTTVQSTTPEPETTILTTHPKEPSVVIQTTQPTIATTVYTSAVTPMSSDAPSTSSKSWKTAKMIKHTTDSNKEVEDDLQKVIGRCKDTLSTISGPTTQNTYGRNEGAWMKDPLAKDEKIYVTNYYYGNTLVEFRNLDNFKQGRWSNSYKLPYSWIGTGHVVYNGSFYYNRAFTRNIIKYDLKHRYVAAWSLLHDVVFEEATPWRWKGHSDIDFAVDENGLWIIYPAIDDEGFLQEVIVLSKLNAQDLTTQKETTFRTGLRKDFFGNCFVICGVLYAVDNYNKKNANISYAFDTHTNTQIIPRLLFENEYSYTTQIDYNPKDRLLYAWDNGHQVTYQVIFAY
ncbi:olfactomedin-like protein 2B isoform X1 [Hyla sarda]|uniref:olfactomedin-like protein 2B isoform X1 n=1 Tax=Hyla sarda TaxID=327740 RepID=UPI0024C3FCDB|nr:olfactomedin-like protein 2B isoform X1 [Hyla sarda]